MGFNPSVRTERTVVGEDRSWLATRKGWDTCRSITLDVSTFTEAENLDGKVLHSGLVLALITATLFYAPYDPDAVDGTQTAAGFLFTSVEIDDVDVAVANNVVSTLIWEGVIKQANLPSVGSAEGMIDAAAIVDLTPEFRFET